MGMAHVSLLMEVFMLVALSATNFMAKAHLHSLMGDNILDVGSSIKDTVAVGKF